MMNEEWIKWVLFNLCVLAMLALDLGVFHRRSHAVSFKEAMAWSLVWVGMALVFNLGVYFWRGSGLALEFFTGYVIEKSLSVDNIFVFLLIFSYFQTDPKYQHKILFWGILGALVMRAIFIVAGVALIERFHWTIYIFAGVLIISGLKMAFEKEKKLNPDANPVLRLLRRFLPVTKEYEGDKFLVRRDGRRYATPLLVVLVVIETSDLIFAVDSIPAILAISRDPFIVYTSNAFAILGLRALFFAMAHVLGLFHYLRYGLSVVLVFVGIKMFLSEFSPIPTPVSLGIIALILALSITASLVFPRKKDA